MKPAPPSTYDGLTVREKLLRIARDWLRAHRIIRPDSSIVLPPTIDALFDAANLLKEPPALLRSLFELQDPWDALDADGPTAGWEALQREWPRLMADQQDVQRWDSDAACPICTHPTKDHPYSRHVSDTRELYLRRLCDGQLVKL